MRYNTETLANGTEVTVEGYTGKGTIIERIEGGYVVRATMPGLGRNGEPLLNEAPVSEFSVRRIDAEHPAIGTTYLDRITGTVYRIRGYSNFTDGPSIAIQYATGAMSSARDLAISDLAAFEVIWEPEHLLNAI